MDSKSVAINENSVDDVEIELKDESENKVKQVCMFTCYDTETARIKLRLFNYDEEEVIRQYLRGDKDNIITPPETKRTSENTNQGIFKTIRTFMNETKRDIA